jgi:glycosyltransferase involved in cell wall biosynthesis
MHTPRFHDNDVIKVCLVIDRLDVSGGPRYFAMLARMLDKSRFRVTIASDPSSPLWNRFIEDGLSLAPISFPGPFCPMTMFQLRRLFHDRNFDIVHSMGLRADFYTHLAARLCRPRPIIVSTIAMPAHGYDVHPWRRRLYEFAEGWATRKADLLITDSDHTRQSILREYALPETCIQTIRIGTSLTSKPKTADGSVIRREWGISNGPLIASLGRLVEQKGHDVFFQAFALLRKRLPSVEAVVVGDGPLKDVLKKMASQLDMGGGAHVFPSRNDLANVLAAINILVIASRSESMPLLLYDAMAMARPIVATAVGGIPEVLEDGVTGILVPPSSPHDMALAIEKFLSDPMMAITLAQQARAVAMGKYSTDHCVQEIQQVYQRLLGGKR